MQGQIINGFELKKLLGEGGMAEVWYAENEIGKPAAVKILFEKLTRNAQIVERFHNEAVMMVKLHHQNIRQVYSYGYIGNRHCIVMEYLEGDDLSDMMKAGRRFTDEELRLWWNQIVSALNYTHKQGIVHRDIKPSNIFLDEEGNIKLLDFGIAKMMENSSLTQTGSMMGTLMYMSPEQVKDSKYIDYHTDIYSLAVTFVHLLTGKKPYDTDTTSDFEIREKIVYTPYDVSVLPEAWQGFLAPYLEKEPQNRPELRRFERTPLVKSSAETTIANVPVVEKAQANTSNAEKTFASAPVEEKIVRNTSDAEKTISGTATPMKQETPVTQEAPKRKSKAGLFIGLGVGLAAIIAAVVVLVLFMKPGEEPSRIEPAKEQLNDNTNEFKNSSQQVEIEAKAKAEAEAKAKAKAEEQARMEAEAEERARQKAEAEEQARIQAEAEEQARVQAEAEEQARQQAEAEAKAKAQVEAEAKAKAEAEAKAKAQAEAKAKAEAQKKQPQKTSEKKSIDKNSAKEKIEHATKKQGTGKQSNTKSSTNSKSKTNNVVKPKKIKK